MAKAVSTRFKLMVESHPLIKYKAFTFPKTFIFRNFFKIFQNTSLKVIDLLYSSLFQKCR